jgi:hypothetical protein
MKSVRVKVLASRKGGMTYGPFVRDARGTGRFPPAVRILASVWGLSVGELLIANGPNVGDVLELRVDWAWLREPVARCLVREADALGSQASWKQLSWRLRAGDEQARAMASALGFQPVASEGDDVVFERPIGELPR